MAGYFDDYSSFIAAKGLPSPADTPYETPSFIRSKRSSRATAGGSSREQSISPPPLPPDAHDAQERAREGKFSAMDPRRFTPTLHASLVSEILNLRRELDSKNNLVENLETSLHAAKDENEKFSGLLSAHTREASKAKQQVAQMEEGTYNVVEDLSKERDVALASLDDLRVKLDSVQKTTQRQDEDAERTQRIWESEKESWDNERRQLERRVHVTESRLRTFVDEMTAQQAAAEAQQMPADEGDESVFKDSGIGNESDTASIQSTTPRKHRRNISSLSYRKSLRHSMSRRSIDTPEPHAKPGNSLADELGIDEEDEFDLDEFDHQDEDLNYNEHLRKTMESRQSSVGGNVDAKAKRILGIVSDTIESPIVSPTSRDAPKRSDESFSVAERSKFSMDQPDVLPTVEEQTSMPRVQYVDTGYQPSPPPSPPRPKSPAESQPVPRIEEPEAERLKHAERPHVEVGTTIASSPISPPATPIISSEEWALDKREHVVKPTYSSVATQTEHKEAERPKSVASKRDSLSPPMFVPSIAIHPPTSRPSSPRPHVLPPGTKNASTQAALPWKSRDACVQTEQIRVDNRPTKLPPQSIVQSAPSPLLPSPTFEEPPAKNPARRAATCGKAIIFQKPAPAPSLPSPPAKGSLSRAVDVARNNSDTDLRSMPLRAIPLPRPVLAPTPSETDGPLNRSAQYGVTSSFGTSSQLLDVDRDTDTSDEEEFNDESKTHDLAGSIPAFARPPHGRFGLSEPPKVVPEDKEISPERRPGTAESYGAAPAPSVASSRAGSRQAHAKPPPKLNAYKDFRSRSPSFGSIASSVQSGQSVAPPFPIPTRSSSRHAPPTHSDTSHSPTPQHHDVFGNRNHRGNGSHHHRQGSLRKVQSAAVMRHPTRRVSPTKSRRRRRHSPDLTPVQSMAFESPAPTKFPIPELPTPLQESLTFDYVKGSMDIGRAPTVASSMRRASEETVLVDSIAATMVGEWMWKYIRKRKSFGVQEDSLIGEDGSVNAQHGTRHKRWVWLSPYERTIMWDSKQPTSGTALLGKKGRKLAIQSVMEVPDDTPMPKDRELTSVFNRSILVLTPARALKFTAISEERHTLWMTALSFLAQSGRLPSQIPPVPSRQPPAPLPMPPSDVFSSKRPRSPSFGRVTVRDSIRIAKGKRPDFHKSSTQPASSFMTNGNARLAEEEKNESADFPAVPRLYSGTKRHQRKRSNTAPRLPQPLNGFRSFSSTAVPSTSSSGLQPGSSFRPSASSKSGSGSARGSSLASPERPNFFEAVETVRMEAFVDPNVKNGVLYVPGPPTAAAAPGVRRGNNISQTVSDKRRAGYVFDDYGNDPFKNF